ncbi:MAG: cytochrome c [Leptospira sp.]|jgi:mono/diheme cytochrome c family protein|nr:cytochrome c [Leptospira sp.]NCS95676.1 cytochrome c [Leptospira sp.]
MKKTILFSTTILLSLFLVSCGDKPAPVEETATEEVAAVTELDADLQAGKEAFEMTCASCHGEQGNADTPTAQALNPKPRNYKAPASEWKNGNTVAGVTKTLKEGIKGSTMVSYAHLGDETIGQIAQYVVYLTKK